MNLVLQPESVPLRLDIDGETLRVGKTRVTLDVMLAAYQEGSSPEELVEHFPTLQLADVYSVLGNYLRHRETLEQEYLEPRRVEAEGARRDWEAKHPPITREALLARKAQRE